MTDIDTMTGLELREAVARRLGWVSWLQQRGEYTHVEWVKPGGREPWTKVQSQYQESARASYSGPVDSFDRRKAIDHDALPHFDTSLDAHFAPGGTVEALGMVEHGEDEIKFYHSESAWKCWVWPHSGHGSTPAEALCRAYLKATGGQ